MPKRDSCTRRRFLQTGTGFALTWPWFCRGEDAILESTQVAAVRPAAPAAAKTAAVGIARCVGYGPEVRRSLQQALDSIGGIRSLVQDKTVTVKLNLTGTNFEPLFSRPVGESYMTHESTAMALVAILKAEGAKRIRLVESTNRRELLQETLVEARWDVRELGKLGPLEFENTRNLGTFRTYGQVKVPRGGHLFASFELNQAYLETDVLISLCKLKQHVTAGVTLSLKNLFGITPNALYGEQAGNEKAVAGRSPLHSARGYPGLVLPGAKPGDSSQDPGYRVPRIVADLAAARPIDLALIDGITSMSGGEGPWAAEVKLTKPGVWIVSRDAVAADAVGTVVMGFENPRARRGSPPFHHGDNHLVLAEALGAGTCDLSHIDVRGLSVAEARHPYES